MAPRGDLLDSLDTPAPDRRGSDFERILLAIIENRLNRDTANRAVEALRDAGLLEAGPLIEAGSSELAELFQSAGLSVPPRLIAPVISIARWWAKHPAAAEMPTASLRDDLIAIRGVGPATADAILLHALDRPVFPVSRAAYRILVRHGWIDATATYEEAASAASRLVGDAPDRLRRLSVGLEAIGARYCRAAAARCESCPLRPWLPEGGPIEPV